MATEWKGLNDDSMLRYFMRDFSEIIQSITHIDESLMDTVNHKIFQKFVVAHVVSTCGHHQKQLQTHRLEGLREFP